ncbi:outer membrane beta-barrel protein [Massilia sp. DWR3-1-1]|uniref:outer membrane beta-barrel protein n=1 Tax=Massilia sp. DWR3-1-1 TaxID=2804559 RepID=UPI003CF20B05
MNNTLRSTAVMALLASAFMSATASAGDTYVGLNVTSGGEAYADFAVAKHVENYNTPRSFKLYGGTALSERYSFELGYGHFGTMKIADPTPGSDAAVRISASTWYAAGKASLPLGDSLNVFGKLGIAANRFSAESNRLVSGVNSFVRPMFGVGADYRITDRVAGVFEYNRYGKSGNFTQQKLELGLKYSF